MMMRVFVMSKVYSYFILYVKHKCIALLGTIVYDRFMSNSSKRVPVMCGLHPDLYNSMLDWIDAQTVRPSHTRFIAAAIKEFITNHPPNHG